MNNGIGFDIKVPDDLVLKLNEADGKLQDIAESSKKTRETFNDNIGKMIENVNALIERLNAADAKINELGSKTGGKANSIGDISNQVSTSIDDINRLIEALERLEKAQNQNNKKDTDKEKQETQKFFEEYLKLLDQREKEAYQITLARMKKEQEERERIESENFERQKQNIQKQNEEYSRIKKEGGKKEKVTLPPPSNVDKWQGLQKSITEAEKRLEELIKSTKEYENILKRIEEGKGGAFSPKDTETYNQNKKEIEFLQQKIQLEREQQEEIVKTESLLRSVRSYNEEEQSLPNLRKKEELEELNKYYQDLEKSSAQAEKKEAAEVKKLTTEYDKLLATLQKIKQQREEAESVITNKNATDEGKIIAQDQLADLQRQEENINRRKLEIEDKLQDKLLDVRNKYRAKDIKEEIKAAEKKAKEIQKTGDTYAETMTFSSMSSSINQDIEAIKALENERNKLLRTDEKYDKKLEEINLSLRKHYDNIKKAKAGAEELKDSHRSLLNISEQLTRRLALAFSVSQVTGYVKKLASVRGEFELQQKSLAAIIQNKDKANEVFDKITKLAVQSPFQLKELISYTKELAAFKIQTDKLYDSTKMLADISAGVGVDMDRLVLAYGQVASANYLRGTELRQFSEAGVNVLGELANYFTELQGRVVGVAEVFDMISRRMVSFKDVDAVLTRMTKEGGEFYGMQAVQAETLKGQISNLKDSIEIMLNEIGKANEGILKGSVALVRDLVENWRVFSYILEDISAILGLITLGNFIKGLTLTGTKLLDVAANGRGVIAMAARLKQGFGGLSKVLSIAGKGMLGWVGIAVALIKTGWDWYRSVKQQNAAYDETINTLGNMSDKATKIAKEYESASKRLNDAQKKVNDETEKNSENQDALNNALLESHYARQEQINLLEKLKTEFPEIYNGLKQEEDGTIKLTEAVKEYNNVVLQSMALQQAMKATAFLDGWKKQVADVEEELKEYDNAVQDAISSAVKNRNIIKSLGENINETDASALKILDNIFNETDLENKKKLLKDFNNFFILNSKNMSDKVESAANEVMLAYQTMREEMVGGALTIGYNQPLINLENNQYKPIIQQFKGAIESLAEEVDITQDTGKLMIQNLYKGMFEKLELTHPELVKRIEDKFKKDLGEKFSFIWTFSPTDENGNSNIKINKPEWQKALEDALSKATSMLPKLNDKIYKDFLSLSGTNTFEIPLPIFDPEKNIAETYGDWVKRFKKAWDEVTETQDKAHGEDQELFTDKQRDTLDLLADAFEYVAKAAGLVKEETKTVVDKTSEQIRVLKELHETYIDLNDIFDETVSKEGVIEKLGKAFKEAFDVDIAKFWEGLDKDGVQLDFTTEDGIVAAFDKLIKSIPDKTKRVQAELAKSEFVMEFKIQAKKNADKEVTDQISKMFDDYESLLELDKLGISGEFAKKYFGIETTDLAQIRKKIEKELAVAEAKGGREDFIAERKKELEKVKEMEIKEQQERLKTYLKYTRDAISERAQIEFEGMRKMAEARKTFDKDDPRLGEALEGIRREMNSALQTLDWKEFSSSDTFVSIFNDLEDVSTQALTSMIDQLEKYKNEWTDLPIDQMEAVAKQLEKMKKARDVNEAVAKPFMSGAFAGGRLNAKDISQAQQDMIDADKSILASNQQVSNMEYLLEMLYEEKNLADQSIVSQERLRELGIDTTKSREEQEEVIQKIIEEEQANVNQQNQYKQASERTLSLAEKQKAVLQAQSEYLGEDLQMANDLYDAFSGLYEALGGDKDNPVAIFADMGMSMANTVIQTIQLKIQLDIARQSATGLGIAMNTAMGVIGWIVMGVQLLTQAISAITKAHDNNLQKQIERDAEAVELLQKRFEKLEEAIDNAMSFGEYQKEFDEAKRNLEEQIRLTKNMIALEEDKKKTDKDAIKGYKDEIEDYNNQLKEMEEKRIEDMGGFGGQDAIKDATEGFVEAWASAYNETGDGIDALKDKWDEYFQNLLKKQMMMKVAGKYMESVLKEINTALEDDILTGEEMEKLKTVRDDSSEQLNTIMKQLAEAMGWEGGLSGGSDLEGLSENIQGVTEVTAQALEAILNSMRFVIIDSNKALTEMVNRINDWDLIINPMLAELRSQTGYLRNISDIFDLVIDRQSNSLRVV